jgi:hypothetical protein
MAANEQSPTPFEELDSDLAPEAPSALLVRSTAVDRDQNPDLETIRSVILKEGPRSRKQASYVIILDRSTGEYHHDAITIKTFKKRKGEWGEDVEHSITLSSDGEDEIQKLLDFLAAARSGSIPKASGDFVVVAAPANDADRTALQELLNKLSASGRIDVLANVLENVHHDSGMLSELLNRAAKHPQLFAEAAAALNLATYKAAVDELHRMVTSTSRVPEAEFQRLLVENPWMFGSEYSELLDRRRWTRDEQQDFVVRRTTDGYIELIEIKTPLEGRALFNYDASHNTLYAGAELSKVVGQVQNYIEKLDRDRNSILANDGEDTTKIRAKIIIGCDGETDQQHALRRFNGHLHRIEVITFNQLLKIAQKVLDYLEGALRPNSQMLRRQ